MVAEWGGAVEVDALSRVRHGTRRRHRQLDRESSLARLAFANCSLTEYRAALVPLARAYARADAILVAAEAHRPTGVAPYRARSPLIGGALSALGDFSSGPVRSGADRAIDNTAAYLGCRYVLDGAQFGHLVIARALASSEVAATLPASALSFWRTRFLATEDWRSLCRRLMNMPTRSSAAAATIAARYMFDLFQSCFAEAASEEGH
ncbi:hypothetical protein [Salinisphaera hydrothermalis]|uniref:hypothetical protein n=1 Tax=Salinisphaera hydrothermalis TaxID=563188 RepID=UPI00055F1D28|nr:hypothetical protein [Salinisphaera hydrothermalis]